MAALWALFGLLLVLLALVAVRGMADLSLTASITDQNTGLTFAAAQALAVTQAGSNKRSIEDVFSVPTTAGGTAVPLGTLGTLGYAVFVNLDATNSIDVLTATSGTIIARLDAGGGFACIKVGSGITAPAFISNTSACRCRYKIWEA